MLSWMIGLTLVAIVLIVVGKVLYDKKIDCNGSMVAIGIIGLILMIVGGWLMAGNLVPVKYSDANIIPFYIHKSSSTVYIEYGNNQKHQFTDAASYNAINDSTKFIIKTGYNMYGDSLQSVFVIIK